MQEAGEQDQGVQGAPGEDADNTTKDPIPNGLLPLLRVREIVPLPELLRLRILRRERFDRPNIGKRLLRRLALTRCLIADLLLNLLNYFSIERREAHHRHHDADREQRHLPADPEEDAHGDQAEERALDQLRELVGQRVLYLLNVRLHSRDQVAGFARIEKLDILAHDLLK